MPRTRQSLSPTHRRPTVGFEMVTCLTNSFRSVFVSVHSRFPTGSKTGGLLANTLLAQALPLELRVLAFSEQMTSPNIHRDPLYSQVGTGCRLSLAMDHPRFDWLAGASSHADGGMPMLRQGLLADGSEVVSARHLNRFQTDGHGVIGQDLGLQEGK